MKKSLVVAVLMLIAAPSFAKEKVSLPALSKFENRVLCAGIYKEYPYITVERYQLSKDADGSHNEVVVIVTVGKKQFMHHALWDGRQTESRFYVHYGSEWWYSVNYEKFIDEMGSYIPKAYLTKNGYILFNKKHFRCNDQRN